MGIECDGDSGLKALMVGVKWVGGIEGWKLWLRRLFRVRILGFQV